MNVNFVNSVEFAREFEWTFMNEDDQGHVGTTCMKLLDIVQTWRRLGWRKFSIQIDLKNFEYFVKEKIHQSFIFRLLNISIAHRTFQLICKTPTRHSIQIEKVKFRYAWRFYVKYFFQILQQQFLLWIKMLSMLSLFNYYEKSKVLALSLEWEKSSKFVFLSLLRTRKLQ